MNINNLLTLNSHAYLITMKSENDYNRVDELVKKLVCPYSYEKDCSKCNICYRIDKNKYPEIIILKDNEDLKKENIIKIQNSFKSYALEGKKRVYIINNVENLNTVSANSLLKFIEEPEDNIVAILLTKNPYLVLPTIKSRCQLITGEIKEKQLKDNLIIKEDDDAYITKLIDISINLVIEYNQKKEKVIVDLKKLVHEKVKDKNDYINLIKILSLFYKDVINYKYLKSTIYFNKHNDIIELIIKSSTDKEILNIINLLINSTKYFYSNANTNLLMDKIFIEMGN